MRTCSAVLVVGVLALAPAGRAVAAPSASPFEIVPGSFHITPSPAQAGAHEDLTTQFDFAHTGSGATLKTDNDVRTTIVELPAGFVGSNTAVPVCTVAQLIGHRAIGEPGNPECPPASQIGTIRFGSHLFGAEPEETSVPLYNMEVTSFGTVAQFGFNAAGVLIQTLLVNVRPGDSGLTITTPNIEAFEARAVSVTVWGLPASHEHDAQRSLECYSGIQGGCVTGSGKGQGEAPHPVPANIPVRPYLSNATGCEPHVAHLRADSWEHPDEWSEAETEVGPLTECERVPFGPLIEVAATTRSAESSSGLDVSLVVPQAWENPFSLSTANLKDSVVKLPVGYTANPSLASGLGVCTVAQFESETSSSAPGAGCPPESKIGTVEVETPVLLEKRIEGDVYIAKPFENPFGTLLGLYIVVKDPARGIVVKLAGRIDPNETTGQLVTTFDESPQVPFSRFTLKLRQGANSPLVSPPACGSYAAQAAMTPWSAPLSPSLVSSAPPAVIETGIGDGPCPPGGVPPFHPGIVAGTLNNSAGAYSPMDIHITRNDGEQEITRFTSILPAGLTAKLAGVPFCPDANIEAAKHLTGAQEEAAPSCPKDTEIGHTLVGAGVGSVLAYTPGKVYMAGPYNGAPFSVVSITSAKVGPFDLGTVVIRFALNINPETAVVTVDAKASDPIPHILAPGIVIHVRDIRVYVDRPQFMINPTNCDPESFAATVDGAGADFTNPADQVPVTVTNSFQMANCQNLQFKPTFKASTSGKPSRLDGESLHVTLTYPNAPQGTQTNIKLVKVELPKQLPSRLPTLQKACPEKTFVANPALCPAASVVGHATATTPILPVPLTGPAYFVSYGGAKFPELIIVLQGYGVTLDLHGETFISKQGITSSTFRTVPDDPIGSFELTLPQGPYSALAANGNPCKGTLTMPTEFLAQNGDAIHQQTKIAVSGCPKHKAKVKRRARKASRGGRRHGRSVRTRRK
ncbi:MAG TPA: hypothetical protein VNY52_04635 [Solirubrobacteraceae bacterium]|nr:hypothetical protein [Solirubrobacteraceae bacterium]